MYMGRVGIHPFNHNILFKISKILDIFSGTSDKSSRSVDQRNTAQNTAEVETVDSVDADAELLFVSMEVG